MGQLIVQKTCLVKVARLEGHLEAAASHAKAHAVHVDMIGLGGLAALGKRCLWERFHKRRRGVLVLEDGNVDGHLGPAALANVGGERAVIT